MNLPAPPLVRPDYQLADGLWAERGTVFLSGTQALVRLLHMQRQADAAAGLDTAGFISGYRGSPLGMVDQAVWKAGRRLEDAGIRFVPAINEELAATQVLGTQRVESDPERTVEGVFAMWYGKGPGVDRAADALKHGNAYGSSPHGGVLVVAGDDHGCVSSSMPHQSDHAMIGWQMPIVAPADVAEIVEFGLYGWALSRYSGAWVGLTALSEVVESAGTVDLDAILARQAAWADADTVRALTGHQPPPDGLHYRWPDLPSLRIESRLSDKLAAVRAFAAVNPIDRELIASEHASVGIVTCGKAHHDLMEVLRRLEITPAMLAEAGVRLLKVGLAWPVEPARLRHFARGLKEILVVEEKAGLVEQQLKELFYNAPAHARPAVVGKHDRSGRPLLSALGELRPSRLIEAVAHWIAEHFPQQETFRDHLRHVRDFTPPELLSNAGDAVKRLPYFCAGCPHNTSTRVPEGSSARAGIGCHFMANWMDRSTAGLIQMGGEGVDWVSHAMFSRTPHVFQNLGDGTYYHSGYLAIRQAVAAKATLTYKILFNDAVAMTGGQPVDGVITVDAIARQVESEGVKRVVVVSDDIAKYGALKHRFPAGTAFHPREDLDAVQRELREVAGVTVLIYEQTCAAEKRRRRKRAEAARRAAPSKAALPLGGSVAAGDRGLADSAEPPKRLFIHDAVCEGCGDCTVQSNCVAVLPHETPQGRKRRIDQTACNKDYSCANGFCPSFVGVTGATLKKRSGVLTASPQSQGPATAPRGGTPLSSERPGDSGVTTAPTAFDARVAALPQPAAHAWTGPWDLLVTGVGGTGVVTVGAVIAMAAHLQGHRASVLDFMGFAQKGGSVLSFVRLADTPERLNQVRIDTQQADALLACDLVVGASPDALQTVRHGRTRILANTHPVPVAESLRHPDASLQVPALLEKMRFAAGAERVETFDAQALAEEFLGDTVSSNILALGWAWQRGLVPVSLPALTRAIELNGVAVATNLRAFGLGRLAAADPAALGALRAAPAAAPQDESLEALVERWATHLGRWQNAAWARRYRQRIDTLRAREAALGADPALPLTRAAATSLARLMSYKDEYEVARLYSDPAFEAALREQFDGELTLEFHMAPPLLRPPRGAVAPRKLVLGPWLRTAMRGLARLKGLRGTALDLFGRTEERRMERALITEFERHLDELAADLSAERLALAVQIATWPQQVRGFGHVKAAAVARARAQAAEGLHRWDPQRHPRPQGPAVAGQFRGIAVVGG